MHRHALVLASLLTFHPLLHAQEKEAPAIAEMPDPKRPQHEALAALTGTWEITMKMEAMPGVPGMEKPTEASGVERAELICNGLWLKSVVDATHLGKPFQGVWLAGYDPFRKCYVSVWTSSDDQECGACTMDGDYDAEAKTWSWSGVTPHGPMRSSFVHKSPDLTVETCYAKGPDGNEMKCMEITRKRQKGAAAVDAAASKPAELGEEHQRLLKDVGEWEATMKVAIPGQEPTEEKGSERVASICGGKWLWSDFHGQFMGSAFEGHALTGFDSKQKQYVSYWVDSSSPTWSQTTGIYDPAKKTYHLTGSCFDPTGKPMTIKEALTWKDDDTRVLKMEFRCEDQASNMEIVYRRKTKR